MPKHHLPKLIVVRLSLIVTLLWAGCKGQPTPPPSATELHLPTFPERRAPAKPAPKPTAPATWGPQAGLVSRGWVAARLGQPTVRLVDLRAPAAQRGGHLPGSVSAPGGGALWAARTQSPAAEPKRRAFAAHLAAGSRWLVLIHAGADLRDHAVAARAYLLLRASGVKAGRVAVMQGGYAAWRREGRPVVTGAPRPASEPRAKPTEAPKPIPRGTPAKPPLNKRRFSVVWTRQERVAEVLVRQGWRLVTARRDATAEPGFALVLAHRYLDPSLGQRHARGPLKEGLAPLIQAAGNDRLVLWSPRGLWASLAWFALRAGLGRRVDQQVVYFGPRPRTARARAAARPAP